jgi:hypothetical protein
MGYFRLFRRIKIAPGVTINVSKSGLSTSFGPKGAKVTIGKRGIRKTIGIPGTGISYTSVSSVGAKSPASVPEIGRPVPRASAGGGWSLRTWAGILIGLVILAAAVGSCLGRNDGQSPPTGPPVVLGFAGQASPATQRTQPPNTPTPAPATLSIKLTARTATVARNKTASVTIRTSPRAACSIDVEYKSGRSKATGLGDKTANSSGDVTWSWKVGSNTTRGTWPIFIGCDLASSSGTIETSLTVK